MLLSLIPPERRNDVIYFNPADFPIGFNLFDTVPTNRRSFVATSVVDTFKSVFKLDDFPAPNIEMFVKASCLALLETQGSTLLGLNYILTSPKYRKKIIRNVTDPIVKDFWEHTFTDHMSGREQRERTLSTVNKIFQLITDPAIRHIVGQQKSSFNFYRVIAEHKVFVASLPQGELGMQLSSIIGSFLLASFHVAALQRADDRSLFPVYIDECPNFSQFTIMQMLAGIRKKGISIMLAHQFMAQLSDEMRAAVLGTVGTTIAFAVGPLDAELLAKLFEHVKPDDLIKLPRFRAYARSDGATVDLHMPSIEAKIYPSAPARFAPIVGLLQPPR